MDWFKEEFLSIFDNFQDIIVIVDQKMVIKFINKYGIQFFNLDIKKALGTKCYEIIHRLPHPPHFCPFKKILKKAEKEDIYIFDPFLKKHLWISIFPIYDNKQKNLLGFFHLIKDVTKYKSIEEELKKEKREKELILESSPTQICLLDTDYNVKWANQLYIKNSLLSRQEIFNKKCYTIWHKRSSPCPDCPVTEAIKTKKASSGKVVDYMGRWWLIKANPVLDEEGTVVGVVENTMELSHLKELEENLKKSEKRFEKLALLSPMGILLFRKDKWIYANPYVCKTTGFSFDELKNMNFWDVVVPEKRDFVKKLGRMVEREKTSVENLEIPILTKDSQIKWVYINAIQVELNDGEAVLVTGMDITEKKELEEKLDESLKDFEDISLNIPDSIIWKIDWDTQTNTIKDIFIPPTIDSLWGIPKNILIKKELWENFCPKEELNKLEKLWNDILKLSKKVFGIEHRIFTGKEELWLYTRVSVRTINSSIRIVGYTANISQRKKMEEELLKKAKEYKTIFESVKDGIIILKDCKVVKCNHNFLNLVNLKDSEVIGKNFWDLFSYDSFHINGLKRNIFTFVNSQKDKAHTFEHSFINLSGKKIYVEITLTSYKLQDEEYILALIRDITEKKKFEEKMRYLSLHDSLTGLYNRSFFETEMRRLSCNRYYPITIIVADIDGLKLINDSMGHKKGDELIKKCALILKNSLRSSDILARMGGDEFAVLLPNTDQRTGENIKERIYSNIEKHNNVCPELPIHLSIGIATAKNERISLETLYREADDFMYWNKILHGRKIKIHMLRSFIRSLWDRDYIKDGHTKKIIVYCKKLASLIGLTRYEIKRLILLAFFHDLGKVAIPDTILFKKGILNPDEWETIKKHSEIGYKIAANMPKIAEIKDLIIKHHERWDGHGYPLRLKNEEIPIECRVFQICEAFDVMTRKTHYREALTLEKAKIELRKNSGTQFDPYLAKKFLTLKPEKFIHEGIS